MLTHRAEYNDIAPYNWAHLVPLFSPPTPNPPKTYRLASTKKEMEAALAEEDVQNPKDIQVLEVKMDRLDIPWRLAQTLAKRDPEMGRMLSVEGFSGLD